MMYHDDDDYYYYYIIIIIDDDDDDGDDVWRVVLVRRVTRDANLTIETNVFFFFLRGCPYIRFTVHLYLLLTLLLVWEIIRYIIFIFAATRAARLCNAADTSDFLTCNPSGHLLLFYFSFFFFFVCLFVALYRRDSRIRFLEGAKRCVRSFAVCLYFNSIVLFFSFFKCTA